MSPPEAIEGEGIAELRKRAREAGLAYRYLEGGKAANLPADVLRARLEWMSKGSGACWEAGIDPKGWGLGEGNCRDDAAPSEAELRACGIVVIPKPVALVEVPAPVVRDPSIVLPAGARVAAVPFPEVRTALDAAMERAAAPHVEALARAPRHVVAEVAASLPGKATAVTVGPVPAALVDAAGVFAAALAAAGKGGIDRGEVEAICDERIATAVSALPARVHEWKDSKGAVMARHEGLAHRMLPEVVDALRIAPPVLLVGPAGSGKSSLLRAAAKVLGVPCVEVCMSAAVSEAQLLGTVRPGVDGTWREVAGPVVVACERGALLVLDEIDGADPNVGVALHSCLDERTPGVFVPSFARAVQKAPGFVVGACANTWGRGADAQYVGRSPLDVATLDRFGGSVLRIDYDDDLEAQVTPKDVLSWAKEVRGVIAAAGLRRVLSTRMLGRLARYRASGLSMAACRARALAGWTDAELARLPAGAR